MPIVDDAVFVSAGRRPPLRVRAEIAALLLAEDVLIDEGGKLTVSPVLHADSVLAVLMALGAHPQREAIVV